MKASLTVSTGVKRMIASILAAIIVILSQVLPANSEFILILQAVAAVFGTAGLLHAAGAGTLGLAWEASVSAALQALAAVAVYIPVLKDYADLIQQLAAIIGSLGIGAHVEGEKLRRQFALNLRANQCCQQRKV